MQIDPMLNQCTSCSFANMEGSLKLFNVRLLICVVQFLTALPFSAPTDGNLTIGLILPYKVSSGDVQNRPGYYYASAMTVAVDNINKDPTFLPGIHLSFIWADSECEEEKSIQEFIRQWEKRVDAFIGFGCKCFTQARMAAALNLPLISHVRMACNLMLTFFLLRTVPTNTDLFLREKQILARPIGTQKEN